MEHRLNALVLNEASEHDVQKRIILSIIFQEWRY